MTTNHHTPIATNAPGNAAIWNVPLASLDSAITALGAGTTGLTGLRLATATVLTISGGAVTKTGSQHTIDTEASASSDDLTTINGYATGDILIISAANASRVVTVKHGTGNIYLYGKMDLVLDDTDKTIELIYRGGRWEQTNGQPTTALTYPTAAPFRVPTNMPLLHHPAARNGFGWKAAAATIAATGVASPTATGTPSASNQTDSTYINLLTGSSAGNSAGHVTTTYNVVRRQYNPKLSVILQAVDVANLRLWIGFFSAAVTTADTVAGATEAAAFRYSPTAASDTGFVPCTKDSSTQTTGSSMNTVAAGVRYLLQIELTSSSAIFTVNNGTPVVITTNLPTTSTELGVNVIAFTTIASGKNWLFSRAWVDYD